MNVESCWAADGGILDLSFSFFSDFLSFVLDDGVL